MQVEEATLPGVKVLTPGKHDDERGFLSEIYSREAFEAAGIRVEFVQENHSFSKATGTIRGLHFQAPPHAQHKLVRVSRGAVFDVVVDLRLDSPTFGAWTAIELSEEHWNQLYVPAGFAHGFCTLEPDTHVLYKVSAPYAPGSEGGVPWNDPDLAIRWPPMERYLLSERDRAAWPALSSFESPFRVDPDASMGSGS